MNIGQGVESGSQRPFTGTLPCRSCISRRKAPRVGADHDHAARHLLAEMQRLHRKRRPNFRHLQRHRRAGVVVHVPEVGADRHRHRDAVALVVGAARGVAVRHAGQVVADHLLVVLEAAAGQHHPPARLDVNRFLAALGAHAEDFLGDVVLDQLPGRRLIEDRDRAAPSPAARTASRCRNSRRSGRRGICARSPSRAGPGTRCRPAGADAPAGRRRGRRASRCCGTSPRPTPHHGLGHGVGTAQRGQVGGGLIGRRGVEVALARDAGIAAFLAFRRLFEDDTLAPSHGR